MGEMAEGRDGGKGLHDTEFRVHTDENVNGVGVLECWTGYVFTTTDFLTCMEILAALYPDFLLFFFVELLSC